MVGLNMEENNKMKKSRTVSKLEAKVFNFLNELRCSGEVNMFGSRPYITEVFDLNKHKSSELLYLWMNNFKENKVWKENDTIAI